VRLERVGRLKKKNSMASSRLEPATFRLEHSASSNYATVKYVAIFKIPDDVTGLLNGLILPAALGPRVDSASNR
jgi:hypothetical protein